MVYVTSDLHGYPLEEFLKLLDSAGFTQNDYLFVLGDVIDRGEQGVQLLRWMAEQPNVELILGNHEAMLLSCEFVFRRLTEDSLRDLDREKLKLLGHWMQNGAGPTLDGLRKLMHEQPDVLEGILDYVLNAPLYDTVEAGGKSYVLVHSGLGNFQKTRPLSSYSPEEILWFRPTPEVTYFDDKTVIFGHTPTQFLDSKSSGKALKTPSWICIDTGAAAGLRPMLLRLDDLKEFYLTQ